MLVSSLSDHSEKESTDNWKLLVAIVESRAGFTDAASQRRSVTVVRKIISLSRINGHQADTDLAIFRDGLHPLSPHRPHESRHPDPVSFHLPQPALSVLHTSTLLLLLPLFSSRGSILLGSLWWDISLHAYEKEFVSGGARALHGSPGFSRECFRDQHPIGLHNLGAAHAGHRKIATWE